MFVHDIYVLRVVQILHVLVCSATSRVHNVPRVRTKHTVDGRRGRVGGRAAHVLSGYAETLWAAHTVTLPTLIRRVYNIHKERRQNGGQRAVANSGCVLADLPTDVRGKPGTDSCKVSQHAL
jgi:hypothetical protein